MSNDSNNNCQLGQQCIVTSKFFTNETCMDESLSDFQEKKVIAGPSNSNVIKKKRKKNVKIKGQKDIRAVLFSKKSELESYSKDFGEVCKKVGIDVDPEQLQLAIALSKSLQKNITGKDTAESAQTLTSQKRTGKIKTTLKEYGFKIPDVQSKRKKHKPKKSYKLLQTPITEKEQNIFDKYNQVLFQNIVSKSENTVTDLSYSLKQLYYIATSAPYEIMKDNDIYYVKEILQTTSNTMCGLLKDWAGIPGRPVSPCSVDKTAAINISEIPCSQDELDVILSGTLKSAKTVIDKQVGISESADYIERYQTEFCTPSEKVIKTKHKETEVIEIVESHKDVSNATDNRFLTVSSTVRSLSPDLFDDEISSVMDNSKENVTEIITSQENLCTTNLANDFMDLTKCVNVTEASTKPGNESNVRSQRIDKTKRNSDDFMELTNCVNVCSQPSIKILEDKIDLTQHLDDQYIVGKVIDTRVECNEIDLTQSSNSNDDLPFVSISGRQVDKQENAHCIVEDNDHIETNVIGNECHSPEVLGNIDSEHKDEIKPTDSADNPIDLDTYMSSPHNETISNSAFFDEYHYSHSNDSIHEIVKSPNDCDKSDTTIVYEVEDNKPDIDLTQSSNESHSNTIAELVPVNNDLGKRDDVSIDYDEMFDNMVDECTNLSNSLKDVPTPTSSIKIRKSIISKDLGEQVSNSSQYSEVFEISDKELDYSLHQSRFDNPDDNFELGGLSVLNNFPNKSDNAIKSNVSDNEVPDDSYLPEVAVKRIKINEDLDNDAKDVHTTIPPDMYSSFIFEEQQVEFENNSIIIDQVHKDAEATTSKGVSGSENENIAFKTPNKNNDYIIKTANVTPMLDYAAMSTPEMHNELDKYGLKPFKRKRAIQLLTHLYNQTHPIVEACTGHSSPSKKFKAATDNVKIPELKTTDESNNHTSPKKRVEPKHPNTKSKTSPNSKTLLSPKTHIEVDRESYMYEVTKETPDIRDIECDSVDWIFQKREKAKVHSCRQPLHIAFHNYVSCRLGLREAILRYEPICIDVVHKELVANGCRYDPKDLLKFMDKKCITVKTAENNSRNKK